MLDGDSIRLRVPEQSDYDALGRILNDKETMASLLRYFKVDTWTEEMIRERFDTFLADHEAGTGLIYAVVLKETDEIVGHCGFKNIDRETGKAEFGIILHRSVWGTAVARECHRLSLDQAFGTMALEEVLFVTDSDNVRMQGFFKKAGIPLTGETDDGYLRYELPKATWESVVKAKL